MALTLVQQQFLHDLVDEYGDGLTKYCIRNLPKNVDRLQLAQDIVQNVYIRAIRDVNKLMSHPNAAAWLFLTCQHILLTEVRKLKRHREALLPEDELQEALTASEMVDAVSAWADAVTVPEVMECIAEILSEEEHKVFDDVFINGYTVHETASRQHISFDKARGKVSSIRKKIKKYFSTLCLFIIIMRCMK